MVTKSRLFICGALVILLVAVVDALLHGCASSPPRDRPSEADVCRAWDEPDGTLVVARWARYMLPDGGCTSMRCSDGSVVHACVRSDRSVESWRDP